MESISISSASKPCRPFEGQREAKLDVLFIASGRQQGQVNAIIQNQAAALEASGGAKVTLFPISGRGVMHYLRSALRLRRMLRAAHFPVLHAHYGHCGIVALLARRRERIVVSFMGDDLLGSRRPDGAITLPSRWVAGFNRWLLRWVYDHSIVKSLEMQAKAAADGHKLSLIPNGVDLERFRPAGRRQAQRYLGWDEAQRHVIFVADPARAEKNFVLAQQAVGCMPPGTCVLHPVFSLPNEALPVYYNAADVLLLTSFHEGSPNVVKEAMACNCPVVATRVGDVAWLLGELSGHYLADWQPQELAASLQRAIEFRRLAGGTQGRERLRELGLDAQAITRRLLEVYERLLA